MEVILALRNWGHLLQGSPHKIVVLVNHANLQHYRHPQNINRRVARYVATLADLNVELGHLPGGKNRADPLSRRPDYSTTTGQGQRAGHCVTRQAIHKGNRDNSLGPTGPTILVPG